MLSLSLLSRLLPSTLLCMGQAPLVGGGAIQFSYAFTLAQGNRAHLVTSVEADPASDCFSVPDLSYQEIPRGLRFQGSLTCPADNSTSSLHLDLDETTLTIPFAGDRDGILRCHWSY